MHKIFRTLVVVAFIGALILSMSLTGCTRHPNEEQCQAYQEQVKAANDAEDLLQQTKQEKADVQKQLEDKQQMLKDVQGEKDKVKNKLSEM